MTADWLETVQTFADHVLRHGRDRYGPRPTPLFADGLNVTDGRPVIWQCDGEQWIVSNLASQQNLFRTLVGLSRLTGNPEYRRAAESALGYHVEHLRRSCGLFQWGGHRFVDLATGRVVGEQDVHEFKCTYPFYELLWEVDAPAAARFIRALWNAHVLDWATLDMNRHGAYARPLGPLWKSPFHGAEPFFAGQGLTFINCGSDLVYAAGLLHCLGREEGALTWALRLAEQYVRARDPLTGLGAYQFSQPRKEKELPDADTSSWGGDRAHRQLGPEFGERALEGKVLDPARGRIIHGRAAIVQLRLAERLGDAGRPLLDWQCRGMQVYARHAYRPQTNRLRALLTDGTVLRPSDIRRPGYYRPPTFEERAADCLLFLSYALAWRLTGESDLWQTARAIARGNGLGDLGESPGQALEVDLRTDCAEPLALLGLVEMCRATDADPYRALARRVGANIVATRFHHGFFLPGPDHAHARFDALEPLALLALEALSAGHPEAVPAYVGGRGYIHGPHDGLGRTYDALAIWSVRRDGRRESGEGHDN